MRTTTARRRIECAAPIHPSATFLNSTDFNDEGHAMLLMHEDLSRAHTEQRIRDAERSHRRHSVRSALRAQEKAEKAAQRARYLLSVAIAR